MLPNITDPANITLRLGPFAIEIYNGERYSQVHTSVSGDQQFWLFGKQLRKYYNDTAD